MSDNQTNVKIGADIGDLKSGMGEAAAAVKHAFTEMNSNMLASVAIGTTLGGTIGNVVVHAFEKLGEALGEAITGTANYYAEAAKLGRTLGTTASEAATLMQQLDDIQVSTDEYTGAAKGLEKQINKNEAGLNKMGLATRDAHGNLRPLNDLMLDAVEIANKHKEGTDRNIAATQLFGKGMADGTKLLQLNADGAKEAARTNDELNLSIGVQGAESARQYKKAMQDVHDVNEGFKKTLGDALLPVLTQFGEWFRSAAPIAITIFKGAIGGVVAAFQVLIFTVKMVADVCFATFKALVDGGMVVGEVLTKLMSGDVAGAWAAAKKGGHEFVANVKDGFNEVRRDAEDTNAKIAALFNRDDPAQTKKQSGGTESTDTKQGKEKELMPLWKEKLQEKIRDEVGFFKESSQMELAYWEQKSNIAAKGSKDWINVQKEIYTLQKKLAQEKLADELDTIKREMSAVTEAGAERVRLSHEAAVKIGENYGLESKEYRAAMADVQNEMIAAEARRVELVKLSSTIVMESRLAELDFEQQAIDQSVAMGEIDNQQRLVALKKLEEKKFQIEQEAALAQAKLIHDDVLAETKAYADIEKAKKAHDLAMKKIDDQIALDKHKNIQKFTDDTKAGFQNALTGMMNGTLTFAGAVKSIFASIGQSLAGIFAQIGADWIKEHVIMRAVAAVTAKLGIMQEAAKAGAGGVASMAAAPFPMSLGAPAFGAEMAAMAGAFTPSAAGGYDIPAGTNPLTQLHEREMVLPAKHADVIRGMAGGVGGTGMTVHINAVDAAGVKKLFMTHGAALADSLKAQARNFKVTSK